MIPTLALPSFAAIGALATRRGGSGVGMQRYPALFGVLSALSGLRVDVANHDGEKPSIAFD